MDNQMEKKKKFKFRFPDTATLLVILVIISAICTYIVPAGQFEREVHEATGRTVVVAGTYASTESNPTSLMSLMQSIYNGMLDASDIAWFIFVVGGAFAIMTKSGAITAGLNKLIRNNSGREGLLLAIIMTAFFVGGMSYGMGEEIIPLVAILVPIAIKMGYDPVVGVAMAVVGLYSGYSAGALNPFNTGIAQGICDLPIFSGLGLRILLGVGALVIAVVHTLYYGRKFKKSGQVIDLNELPENIRNMEEREFNKTDSIILVILALTIAVIVFGVIKFDWYLAEFAAVFLVMGIAVGMIYFKGDFNATINEFVEGCKDIAPAVMLVCFGRAVLIVLQDGNILDTLVYATSIPLSHLPKVMAAWGMYISQGLVNFIIPSSSGQAVVVMPIMSALADVLGITRQTAVLAFECGDGFWNMITPVHPILMASLGLAGVSFKKWFKYALPLVLLWSVWVCIVLAIAVMTGYGPF
ncbi:MAG: AbgT family transporter [Firmicutes bacterium]|nr:AbgT family transporter [Bacillota bacterium]